MNTKPWRERKALSRVEMRDELWMEDEIDDLRAEAVGLEAELRAWRSQFPFFSYEPNGGYLLAWKPE